MLIVFDTNPDWYKTQEMCDRVVSEDPFLIAYCPDKYITQTVWWSCWWFSGNIET